MKSFRVIISRVSRPDTGSLDNGTTTLSRVPDTWISLLVHAKTENRLRHSALSRPDSDIRRHAQLDRKHFVQTEFALARSLHELVSLCVQSFRQFAEVAG